MSSLLAPSATQVENPIKVMMQVSLEPERTKMVVATFNRVIFE